MGAASPVRTVEEDAHRQVWVSQFITQSLLGAESPCWRMQGNGAPQVQYYTDRLRLTVRNCHGALSL